MVKTKEELKARIKEIEDEKAQIERDLEPFRIAERARNEWSMGFGWPRISQELGLRAKLDEETYEKLYSEVAKIVDKIAEMIPEEPKRTTWQKIKAVFQ